MTADEVVRRLRAWERGKPLANGETLRVPRVGPNQILILAFVRMGGESAPWGVAYGLPGRRPEILTVPEARTRDDVADMMAKFAPMLLKHVHHPQHSPFGPDPDAKIPPFQVWVPNESHLEMLHNIAYSYTFTKFGEDLSRRKRLNALGHACGWLFRESQRPGQMIVMPASTVLAEAYTFPAETTRQSHLGFLLAWLESKGGREARTQAAEAAERLSISTNLDPAVERDEIAYYVDMFNQGRDEQDSGKIEKARTWVHKRLCEELERRFEDVERAIAVIRDDKRRENAGLTKLVDASLEEHSLQYRRIERKINDASDGPAFVPSPETDRHPAAAGSRFYVHEASQELCDVLLVHDDRELQAQLVAGGEAIAGTIIDVRDEGAGKRKIPVWIVESDGELPLRLREGSGLCVVGLPARELVIRSYEKTAEGRYRFELVVTKLLTVPRKNDGSVLPASSPKLKRRRVVLVKPSMDGIARRKSALIWNRDVPGAWLTHAVPKVAAATLPEEVSESLSDIQGASS